MSTMSIRRGFRSISAVAALLSMGIPGLWGMPAEAATAKRVACALPFVVGQPTASCNDWHKVQLLLEGYDESITTVTAEVLALDEQGGQLLSLPVQEGVLVRTHSDVRPDALKLTQNKRTLSVTGPVPMVHVTAFDGTTRSEAFCSNIPFLQMISPNNDVVSVSTSSTDVVHVLAAMPLVDPKTLVILVDGADLLALLGIGDPSLCTPSSPCDGTTTIGTQTVTVTNLVVDSGAINQYASNTLAFDISGLGCGGHVFNVKGTPRPGAPPFKVISPTCHTDPLDVRGLSSGFGIIVDKPADQETGLTFPVEVKGEICAGRPINAFHLQGKLYPIDPSTLTHIAGNGTTTADTYKFDFDVPVGQTDLAQDIRFGTAPPGTFDLGTNRLVMSAVDDVGNRTYFSRFFATGTTVSLGFEAIAPALRGLLEQLNAPSSKTVDIPNALFIGLSPDAIKQQINQRCNVGDATTPSVKQSVRDKILQKFWPDRPAPSRAMKPNTCPTGPPGSCGSAPLFAHFDPSCSCAVDIPIWVTSVEVGVNNTDTTCSAELADDVIHVTVTMPDVKVKLEGSADGLGHSAICGDECDLLHQSRTRALARTEQTFSGSTIKFDITKEWLETGKPQTTSPDCPSQGTCGGGPCAFVVPGKAATDTTPGVPAMCVKLPTKSPDPPVVDKEVDIPCFLSGVTCLVAKIIDSVVNILTLGLVDLDLFSVDFSLDADLTAAVGAASPDPFGLKNVGVDPEKVQEKNVDFTTAIKAVKISKDGMLATLDGKLTALKVDVGIRETPGANVTHPPAPTLPIPDAKDAVVALNVDTLNVMNAGITVGGAIQTSCGQQKNADGSTIVVMDVLPHSPTGCKPRTAGCVVDCENVECDDCNDTVVAAAQGWCHGVNEDDCESLTAPTALARAAKQGACHGARGDACAGLPLAERATCAATPDHVKKTDPILFCTRQDIPPGMFPLEKVTGGKVDATLRLPALSVAIVVDRDNAGKLEKPNLEDLPDCKDRKAPTTGQCAMVEACLDVNAKFNMTYVPPEEVATCGGTANTAGVPGIKNVFTSVLGKTYPGAICTAPGVMCSALGGPGSQCQALADYTAKSKPVQEDIGAAAQQAAPPLCLKGFDLGKFVSCDKPSTELIVVETNGNNTSKDFVGVTCKITAP